MTNARLFGHLVERFIKPTFQSEADYSGIDNFSKQTDKYLLNLFAYAFQRSPVQYEFYYNSQKSAKSTNESLVDICLLNAMFNFETKSIEVYFTNGFSKFYFKNKESDWEHYLENLKKIIQHELVHYTDLAELDCESIQKVKGTIAEIDGVNINPNRKKINIFNHANQFVNLLTKKGFVLYDFYKMIEENPEDAQLRLIEIFSRYKKKADFDIFCEMYKNLFVNMVRHNSSPLEVRAMSEDIILELFQKGYSKFDILELIKKDIQETKSETYNSIADMFGSNSELMRLFRAELADQITSLIELSEKRKD